MYKSLIIISVVLVALGALGYMYLSPASVPVVEKQGAPTATAPVATTPIPPYVEQPDFNARTVAVVGNEFSFTPKEIRMKLSESINILFTNEGVYPHNIVISDLGLTSATVQKGESTNLLVAPTKKGTFEMHCGIGNHKEKGMVGTLIVE